MHIKVESLTKRYGKIRPLNDVSLEIEPGQIIALVGANGAGKTTLLRCFASVTKAGRGRILYDGEPFTRDRVDLRRRLYFMPDFPLVLGEMTVLQHVGMMLHLYGRDRQGIEERVLEVVTGLDLLTLVDTPMGNMSRGQLYKAALTGLIILDPELWLLDEPFASGMDPNGISLFKKEARAAAGRGRTVVYSTQLLDVAENLSDRVCILDKGEVRSFAPLSELQAQSTSSADGGVLEDIFRQMREER